MRKFTAPKFLLCFAIILALPACTNTRKAEYSQPLEEPDDAHPAPIKFTKLKISLPLGKDIGQVRINCLWDYFNVGGKALRYDVVNAMNINFDDEIIDEFMRAEYKISAKIIDADLSACGNTNGTFKQIYTPEYKGKLFLKIEWAVYDNLRKTTVYKTTTDGYTHQKQATTDGLKIMISDAFAMAAHNLGTDKHFHDLIFFGTPPSDTWRQSNTKKHAESRPRAFDPMENVIINNPHLSKTALSDHIDRTRKIAVLVRGGVGHGSGFFITPHGHILTNQHVVGDAMRVRIVTADKKEKLIAEVLRTDKIRDIALLKIEEIPKGLEIMTAPVKTTWPKVSEDIYALGAPQYTKLQDTLTKGIVSAHRRGYKRFNQSLDLIQGDVSIHGGNSGGPLLDAYGNIIGISAAGFAFNDQNANDGLNLFIPIEEALKALDIKITK